MRFSLVTALACASSALAYTITYPNNVQGWTNQGPQKLEWSRVDSDPRNVTVVLTNSDSSLMTGPQVLVALLDGDLGSTTVNPPSAGWPSPGTGYRVNFVRNVTQITAILAQSPNFEIELSTVTPTNTRTSTRSTNTQTLPAGSQPTDDTLPNNNNNGAGSLVVPAALVAAFSFVPALLM